MCGRSEEKGFSNRTTISGSPGVKSDSEWGGKSNTRMKQQIVVSRWSYTGLFLNLAIDEGEMGGLWGECCECDQR